MSNTKKTAVAVNTTKEADALGISLDAFIGDVTKPIAETQMAQPKKRKVGRPPKRVFELTEEVPAGMRLCTSCGNIKNATTDFSVLKGNQSNMTCKTCRAKATAEWTRKRADFRKEYHKAIQLQYKGIPAVPPSAKTWKAGDPILTTSGEDAEKLWKALKTANKARKEIARAEANKLKEVERRDRKAEKARLRLERASRIAEEKQLRLQARLQRKTAQAEERAKFAKEKAEARLLRIKTKAEERARLAFGGSCQSPNRSSLKPYV